MLTKKQNFLETIKKDGHPDRFVKQFEFLVQFWNDPIYSYNSFPAFEGDEDRKDLWGVTWSWPKGTPGAFNRVDNGLKVLTDVTKWESQVKAPPVTFPDKMWRALEESYKLVDRNEQMCGPHMMGIFEQTHFLMGMEDALMAFYEEPECMHELIDFLVQWEMDYMKVYLSTVHPDILYHDDDWGSRKALFMSKDMFDEFYLEPYKKLYKFYKDNGIEVIVHHSDTYAEPLIPEMIEMGIDVWQGGTLANDLMGIIDKYGDQITIMAGIDTPDVDYPGWKREDVEKAVRYACETFGKYRKHFIPCQTAGSDYSTYEGVYDAINEEIDKMSKKMF